MKILHSVGSFVNGGVETLLLNVANRQVQVGNKVAIMIVTNKWSQDMINALDKRIKVFMINKPIGSKNPWYLLKMLKAYKMYNADILHLHGPGSSRLFFPKGKHERRIVTIHNETIPVPFSNTVDQYIAISECVLESFKKKTGHDNCMVCYNGVDQTKFKVRSSYHDKPLKLLSVGRVLFEVKGQDIVLEGISRLPEHIKEQIHLDIWGDGSDMESMKQMIERLNLDNIARVCGNKDNAYVAHHICDYDVMIQASRHEGLGISAIEAMMSGVPVFVSSAKGFLEVTEDGNYGKVFSHSDVNAFVASFVDFFNNYPVYVEIAKKAKPYAIGKFSLDSYITQIMEIYKN